jgi:hypothetical protein
MSSNSALHDHLLVDAPQVLAAPGHLGVDAQLGEPLRTSSIDLRQVQLALGVRVATMWSISA